MSSLLSFVVAVVAPACYASRMSDDRASTERQQSVNRATTTHGLCSLDANDPPAAA